MKIIFECNEQEARDMLALKEQYDNYQVTNSIAAQNEEKEEAPKRKIGFSAE